MELRPTQLTIFLGRPFLRTRGMLALQRREASRDRGTIRNLRIGRERRLQQVQVDDGKGQGSEGKAPERDRKAE